MRRATIIFKDVTEDAGINLRKRERGGGSGEKGMGEVRERVGPGSRWLQGCSVSGRAERSPRRWWLDEIWSTVPSTCVRRNVADS